MDQAAENMGTGCSCLVTLLVEIFIAVLISPFVVPLFAAVGLLLGLPHMLAFAVAIFVCLGFGWGILYAIYKI